jgi:hypothetical protein
MARNNKLSLHPKYKASLKNKFFWSRNLVSFSCMPLISIFNSHQWVTSSHISSYWSKLVSNCLEICKGISPITVLQNIIPFSHWWIRTDGRGIIASASLPRDSKHQTRGDICGRQCTWCWWWSGEIALQTYRAVPGRKAACIDPTKQ